MSNAAAQVASDIRVHDYLHLIGVCIMYWDHLLTFDQEIFLWKRVGSASAYLFFTVRYAGFVGNIPVTLFTFYTIPPHWCHAYHLGHQAVLIGTQLIVSAVMVLRVYALSGRSRKLLAFLLAVGLPLIAIVLWATLNRDSEAIDGFPGCHVRVSQSTFVLFSRTPHSLTYQSPDHRAIHLAASWEALFLFDTLVFSLLIGTTYTTLFLRDGAAIAFANLCNILTFYLAGPILAGGLSTFASCMSVTMMSRAMLNLHKHAKKGVLSSMQHISVQQSNVVFAMETPARWDLRFASAAGPGESPYFHFPSPEDVEMQRRGVGKPGAV
ncbi:hypothetical protein B0H19DRAFT_1129964 [Mycena capillaripes]|nr:hypothetical protein B0H19DRAFT_1129964 [Mycena capillaripes]